MKKLLLSLFIAAGFCPALVQAQNPVSQGVINYDLSINLKAMAARESAAMAAIFPDKYHMKVTLTFKKEVFSMITTKGENKPFQFSDMMEPMLATMTNGKMFVNLKTGMLRGEDVFNQKAYYTESKMTAASITYINEVKTILGYKCYKATLVDKDKSKVTVWYTTALPFAYSPDAETLYGIKGAVLEYQTEEAVFTAVSINPKAFTEAAVTNTANAKKITKEQMDDLTEERSTEQEKEMETQKKREIEAQKKGK